jgi:uncharacterized protein
MVAGEVMVSASEQRAGASGELVLAAIVVGSGFVLQRERSRRWEVVTAAGAAGAALIAARASGASWEELGLTPDALRRGLRTGGATLVPIGAAVALAVALPSARRHFGDARVAGMTNRELAYHVLVRVPLATAVAEELLFRSAVLGTELRRGPRVAVLSSSIAFGLWHVAPALRSHAANPGLAEAADQPGGRVATIVATVGATAAAGAVFAWLRLRSRSVAAPIVAHAAVNTAALLASRVVTRRHRSRCG